MMISEYIKLQFYQQSQKVNKNKQTTDLHKQQSKYYNINGHYNYLISFLKLLAYVITAAYRDKQKLAHFIQVNFQLDFAKQENSTSGTNEDFESQNKLFQWRNGNPNSQYMVNVLSVGKDEFQNQPADCGSWCPSQRMMTRGYVVTERILKLGEMEQLQRMKMEMESLKHKVLYATGKCISHNYSLQHRTLLPFVEIKFTAVLAAQLIKDWLRGIELLCYKFGYFKITPQHLGMNLRQRGTVWISDNYAINRLGNDKVVVATAQQKFRYEKDIIGKIIELVEGLEGWKSMKIQLKTCATFQEACIVADRWSNEKIKLKVVKEEQKTLKQKKSNHKHNFSLEVQHGSFLSPRNNPLSNNQSYFMFAHQNAFKKLNSEQQILSTQRLFYDSQTRKLTSSSKSLKKSIKRSNTSDKLISRNQSPQHQQILNESQKHYGKQTAPTAELGHSSSVQSVQGREVNNYQIGFGQKNMPEKGMLVKSQNDIKLLPIIEREDANCRLMAVQQNKVYYPQHNAKHSFSSEMFRSQNVTQQDFNITSQPRSNPHPLRHNYSLDQHNIVGPYRKDRIYSNMRKEKIMLVDSMVMVREQSEDLDEDGLSPNERNFVLEESIIIRGKEDDHVLAELYH